MAEFAIHLAAHRGFCSGVRRALRLVDDTLAATPPPVYLLHGIVHNSGVVRDIAARGGVVVESLDAVPDGGTVVFSAHGVPRAVEAEARRRRLTVVDATCPLVKKIHAKAVAAAHAGHPVVLIGHAGHPETVGTLGQMPGAIHLIETADQVAALPMAAPERAVVVLSQSTLSRAELAAPLAALRRRYPALEGDGDLCYATTERQDAVRELCRSCELILVLGSATSSNSNRLCEVARQSGRRARLVDSAAELRAAEFQDVTAVGVTAGASAPETLVEAMIAVLTGFGGRLAH